MKLERIAYLPFGTLGQIQELEIYTLELPWRMNRVSESCIPEGVYQVKPDEEGRYTGYPELQDVPGRSEIIIHSANHTHQIEGCIAPGLSYSISGREINVWNSNDALARIKALGPEFEIEIAVKRATI